jgi:hypothetical protein
MRTLGGLVLGAWMSALAGCQNCEPECASPSGQTFFVVTTPTVVTGLQATLTGPVTVNMDCSPDAPQTYCTWPPYSTAVTAGSYSLQVSAPGYQTTTVPATVTLGAGGCGCTAASFEPSTVTITAADAGTD